MHDGTATIQCACGGSGPQAGKFQVRGRATIRILVAPLAAAALSTTLSPTLSATTSSGNTSSLGTSEASAYRRP